MQSQTINVTSPLPDPTALLAVIGLEEPVIGAYDVPDPTPFAPVVEPQPGTRPCVFSFFQAWRIGQTLHLTRNKTGRGGASDDGFVELIVL